MKILLNYLVLFLSVLSFNSVYGQSIIAMQGFEDNGTDTWNDTTLIPTAYNISSDVWAAVSSLGPITEPSEGSKFWGIRDIDNSNGGGDFWHYIVLNPIDVLGYTTINLSFDYYSDGYDSADELSYWVEFDEGSNWNTEVSLSKNTDAWTTISIPVNSGASHVRLRLGAIQNGGSDYAGFDNIKLSGTPLTSDPSLSITNPNEGSTIESSSSSLEFAVSNFTIDIPSTGDGYIKWTLNDIEQSDVFTTDPIALSGLTNGAYQAIIKLVDNSGADLDPSVADTVNFTVNIPAPSISINNPIENDIITTESTDLVFTVQNFAVGNSGGEDGYVKWALNGSNETDVFNTDAITLNGLTNGAYQAIIKLVDNSGADLNPPVADTVNFTVELFLGVVETFDNSNATSSYGSGTFSGVNGINWSYAASRDANGDANDSGIDLPALMLRRASSNSAVGAMDIPGGIGNFSVKLYKGFTSGGSRQVELFINDISYGTSEIFDDFDEHVFAVNGINVSGNFDIRIENLTSSQIIVDDIAWTSYGAASPPSIFITSPTEGETLNTPFGQIEFTATNFAVAAPEDGDGYIKWSLNGVPQSDVFTTDPIALNGLTNGVYQAILNLVNNSGDDLIPPVADTVNFNVDIPPPAISITSPIENDVISSSASEIAFNVQNFVVGNSEAEDGYIKWSLNGSNETQAFITDPIALNDLTHGAYQAILKLVDNSGADLIPSVADTVNFTVDIPLPAISITSPIENDVISTSASEIAFNIQNFVVGNSEAEDGYIKWSLNGSTETDAFTTDPIALNGLTNGAYQAILKLVDNSGADLIPSVADTVSFTVELFVGVVETFSNSNAGSSYSDNSFNGVNGINWTYTESRDANNDVNDSGIQLPALMLRNASSSFNSGVISGGIGDFSIKLYKGFTGSGNRQVEVFVNEISYGLSEPFDDYDEHVFTIPAINIVGDFTLRIANVSTKQVIIDDVSWTAGPNDPVLSIIEPTEGAIINTDAVNVTFNVFNFSVSSPGTGDGFITYQIDGGTTIEKYNISPISLLGLAQGSHSLIMELVDEAGQSLVPPVSDQVNFTVSIPELTILSPTQGQSFDQNQVDIVFELTNFEVPTQGKIVYSVNGGSSTEHLSTDPISLTNLVNGGYTVQLELVDDSGQPLPQPIVASVDFIVDAPFIYPVQNGDFELWTNNTPDFWPTMGPEIAVSREEVIVHGGDYAANVEVLSGNQGSTDFRQSVDIVAGQKYVVSCWIYHTEGSLAARLYVNGSYLTFSDENIVNQWQEVTAEYTATFNGSIEVGLRFYDQLGFDGEETVYVDDFELGPVKSNVIFNYAGAVEYDSSGTWVTLPKSGKNLPVGGYNFRFTYENDDPIIKSVSIGEQPVELTMLGLKYVSSEGVGIPGVQAEVNYEDGFVPFGTGITDANGEINELIDGLYNFARMRITTETGKLQQALNPVNQAYALMQNIATSVKLETNEGVEQSIEDIQLKTSTGWISIGSGIGFTYDLLPIGQTVRIYKNGKWVSKKQNIAADNVITFKLITANVLLNASTGTELPIDDVQIYLNGTWQSMGNGTGFSTELMPAYHWVRILKNGNYDNKQQNLALNSTVVFSMENVSIRLEDPVGNEIAADDIQIYEKATKSWTSIGSGAGFTVDLFPRLYWIRVKSNGEWQNKKQNIAIANSFVFVFSNPSPPGLMANNTDIRDLNLNKTGDIGVEAEESLKNNNDYSVSINNGIELRSYPNPFRNEMKVEFEVSHNQTVNLYVFDLNGRMIKALKQNQSMPSGHHSIEWDGTDQNGATLPSGTYIVKLMTEKEIKTLKIIKQ